MPARRTPSLFHFIIPSGLEENYSWSGEWGGVRHEISPIALKNGTEFAIPSAVLSVDGFPQGHLDSLLALNNMRELCCCDFRDCQHAED